MIMTELEKCIYDFLVQDAGVHNRVCAKARAAKILKIARKQIVSEIDKENVYEQCYTTDILRMSQANAYMKGIEDTLNKIKGE